LLGQPLGTTPFVAYYVPNIPLPTTIAESEGGSAGLAWLVEIEPLLKQTSTQDYFAAGCSGLDPCGLVGLGRIGNIPRKVAVAAPVRRYVTNARGAVSSDAYVPAKLDRKRIDVRREMPASNSRLSGFVAATSATLVLDNGDGSLDGFVADEIIRDRPIRLKVASTTRHAQGHEVAPDLADFGLVFSGRGTDLQVGDTDRLQLRVADDITRLDRPIQSRLYSGTGGVMGGPELAGKPIPLTYGTCKGVSPTLIDPLRLIYQVHDGEFLSVLVRDRGQALEAGGDVDTFEQLAALTGFEEGEDEVSDIPAGAFITCRAQGFFRLGSAPVGTVTADVEGDGLNDGPILYSGGVGYTGGIGYASPGRNTHRRFAGGMCFRILTTRGYFFENEIDVARITQFDQEYPWPLGLHISTEERPTIREVCTRIADSVGAVVLRNQQGQLFLRALTGPGTSSPINVNRLNLGPRGVERVALPWGAPWWSVRVAHSRQWSPLSDDEVAADLDAAEAAAVKRNVSVVECNDQTLQALIPDRQPLEIDTLLTNEAHAVAMGTRIQAFYGQFWAAWRVLARGLGFRTDPLDTVVVEHARYGLDAGRSMLCIAIQERPGDLETEMVLLG